MPMSVARVRLGDRSLRFGDGDGRASDGLTGLGHEEGEGVDVVEKVASDSGFLGRAVGVAVDGPELGVDLAG